MVGPRAVRRAYDDLAATYASERPETGSDVDLLARFLGRLPGSTRVLDAGCGLGSPVLAKTSRSATAVGLDISRRQLRLAAENASPVAPIQGDVSTLPVRDGTFDAVVAY